MKPRKRAPFGLAWPNISVKDASALRYTKCGVWESRVCGSDFRAESGEDKREAGGAGTELGLRCAARLGVDCWICVRLGLCEGEDDFFNWALLGVSKHTRADMNRRYLAVARPFSQRTRSKIDRATL